MTHEISIDIQVKPPFISWLTFLLSEEPSRYLVEVTSRNKPRVVDILSRLEVPYLDLGITTISDEIRIGKFSLPFEKVKHNYLNTLPKYMEE